MEIGVGGGKYVLYNVGLISRQGAGGGACDISVIWTRDNVVHGNVLCQLVSVF